MLNEQCEELLTAEFNTEFWSEIYPNCSCPDQLQHLQKEQEMIENQINSVEMEEEYEYVKAVSNKK